MHFSKGNNENRTKRLKKKRNSVRQRTERNRIQFWKMGEPLTKKDQKLLDEVRTVYEKQGYIPSKKEVANVSELKGRFRTWKDVLLAAGLPDIHDAEQVQKRQQAALRKKESE